MKITKLHLGTLKVNAFEMIMGLSEAKIRAQYPVDEHNQMRIGMNALLVEMQERIILFDPGTATFLPKRLDEEYQLEMEYDLPEALSRAGYKVGEVTDVVFTHLHFDHGSGAFLRVIGGIKKAFPNANYVVSRKQLEAIEKLPSEEQSSYFHKLLRFAGLLTYFEDWHIEGIRFLVSHGHTEHMVVPLIDAGKHDVLFASDLIPMKIHQAPGAWSYYDKDAGLLQEEKREVLSTLRQGSEIVYYHEPVKNE